MQASQPQLVYKGYCLVDQVPVHKHSRFIPTILFKISQQAHKACTRAQNISNLNRKQHSLRLYLGYFSKPDLLTGLLANRGS